MSYQTSLNDRLSFSVLPFTEDGTVMFVGQPVTTPDAEEQLLIPLRVESSTSQASGRSYRPVADFDPGSLPADRIDIDLEVGPSIVCVYGGLIMNLYSVKENYLGENQHFTDISKECSDAATPFELHQTASLMSNGFDKRKYRPLEVTVNAALHDIQAHLMKVGQHRQLHVSI